MLSPSGSRSSSSSNATGGGPSSSPAPCTTPLLLSDGLFDSHPVRYLLQCARHPPPSQGTLPLKLRMPSTETRTEQEGNKKTYTVFLIQIMSCCASFSVLRRYSDFAALHRDLSLEFPTLTARLPVLPGKMALATAFGSSRDAEFVAARRTGLEAYMTKLFGEPLFVNSKALSSFFVAVREAHNVNVKLGSNVGSRTSSSASQDSVATSSDSSALAARMSTIASALASLEQKLKWVEASSGAHTTHDLEHEVKVIHKTLEGLKKKVGVLELTQPYLQQMNHASNNNSSIPAPAPITSSITTSTSSDSLMSSAASALAASSGMNGNARPFMSTRPQAQSYHRSVSGPVGLRYDWAAEDYTTTGDTADEEEEDDFGGLPKRSISQRAVALPEKRSFMGGAGSAWTPSVGVAGVREGHGFAEHSTPDGEDESRDRGRSFSESHASRQFFGQNGKNSRLEAGSPASASSSAAGTATGTGAVTPSGHAIPVRSVLDNSQRSLSSIDPWHSHRFVLRNSSEFQQRNRTESLAVASTQSPASGQQPRPLTTRQHSDPLAANPNSSGHHSIMAYRQWVEDLGIEVGAERGVSGAGSGARSPFSGDANKFSHRSTGSIDSLNGGVINAGSPLVPTQNLLSNEKASLFAGFGQAFPFISKTGRKTSGSTAAASGSAQTTPITEAKNSLFAMSMPLVLPPAAITSQSHNTMGASASAAIALPRPSVAHPRLVMPGSVGEADPELPHSPELGSSPNLGDSPELHALAAATAAGRSTLSPRAYGISPVNLATIFPPPNLRSRLHDSRDDDEEDAPSSGTNNFAHTFEKQRVAARTRSSEPPAVSAVVAPVTVAPSPISSLPSLGLSTTTPLVPESTDLLLELDPTNALFRCCIDAALNSRMTDLLSFISPSLSSEARYNSVLQFIESLIKRQIGAEVFCHGSFALKTYLPDADLDVSAFFSKVHEETWVQKLVGALCQEAAIPTVGVSPQYAVKSVSFINAVCQVVKCQIGAISVDISGNQTGALATLALFEEVDKLVGQGHLFKRTILLTKTWCQNEAGIVDSGAGMLSSYCIRALVLYIFNAYHSHIKTPMHGLFFLLSYFGQFDFMEHAVGVFGPIQLSALPKFQVVTEGPCAWPADVVPLISRALLNAYSLVATQPATGTQHKHKAHAANETLARTYLNVTDPCNPFNNLGRSVSQPNAPTVRAAFKQGSINMRKMLSEWHAHVARRPECGALSVSAAGGGSASPSVEDLDELDALEAHKLVSRMFPKTVALYSAFGGRGRFLPPRRRTGRLTDSGANSHVVSGTASPSLFNSSPQLRPVGAGSMDVPLADDPLTIARRAAGSPSLNSASPLSVQPTPPTPLDANLPRILDNLNAARQFETPDVSEADLVTMIRKILLQYGGVPVGKLGSLLHNVMNNHSLPSMLKERYGGLKKFLERHTDAFVIGTDHPFNPLASLTPQALQQAQKEAEAQAIADHQAHLAQMVANGQQPHSQHSNHTGGFPSAGGHQQQYGQHGGGGRGQQNYASRGGGQQRGGQQYGQGHHHGGSGHYNNSGGNQAYNQKQHGGGGARYSNQQTINAAAAAAAITAAQLQQQQASVAFAAHPTHPLHHHSVLQHHPTSPPHMQPQQQQQHQQPAAHYGPAYGAHHTRPQQDAAGDYAFDFPSISSVMKQHR